LPLAQHYSEAELMDELAVIKALVVMTVAPTGERTPSDIWRT